MELLFIEENPAMQATLQRSFERRGMMMAVCGEGAKALDRWRASVADVVLLDLSPPYVDGLAVLERARRGGLNTPVLELTAPDTVEQLRQQGDAPVLDWAPIISAVALELSALIAERNLEFELAVVAAPVRAHEWALRELTRNLVHNAIKYSPERGALHVTLVHDGRHAALTVTDEGPGIPAELRRRLFQPFARGERAQGEGAGLGLAICEEVATHLGGSIVLENRHLGSRIAGLDAIVRLPLTEGRA